MSTVISKREKFMKPPRIGITLFVFVLIGIIIFAHILIRQEKEYKIQDLLDRGNYLVSLISLHPIDDFSRDKRDFLLKTLTGFTTYKGLLYFFVHDDAGRPIVSLDPSDVASKIPNGIQMASLNAMGLAKQTFKGDGSQGILKR
jgi:hypothetical protein